MMTQPTSDDERTRGDSLGFWEKINEGKGVYKIDLDLFPRK